MEEEKAAAYFDELTRKAARFKQGLGFSSGGHSAPSRGSALPSSSSFLNNFVKSSSPTRTSKFEKEAQLEAIQNKLKKNKQKDEYKPSPRVSERHRHRSRSRSRERRQRMRSRSRSRERHRDRRHRRSRSRSRDRDRNSSPRERMRRSEKSRGDDRARGRGGREKNGAVDYSKLIAGYEHMTTAEKVKARMKLQLSETAEKDASKGMGSGWERFEFDKDAPLDDEEIEAAEDDAELVKNIGHSFRFSALEARKEEQIKAAHDEAMFGAPVQGHVISDSEPEADNKEQKNTKTDVTAGLLSEKVLAKQQGSWRDRARKGLA